MRSLATGQVHEQQLAAIVHALFLNFDLGDRVTPARRVIGLRRVRRTHLVSLLDQIEDLVVVVNELLFESSNLNGIRLILSKLKLIMFVKEVIYFPTVNLIHRYCYRKIPLVHLPVVYSTFEKIFYCNALYAIHRVCLARSRLPVCEYCYYALIEDQVENGPHLIKIQLLVRLMLTKRIIEFEFRVFNGFGYAIDLVLAVMNKYFGVHHRHNVYLAIS